MDKEMEKEDKKWARKTAKNISDSSWSGDDRAVIQLMLYKQLKRIADALEETTELQRR